MARFGGGAVGVLASPNHVLALRGSTVVSEVFADGGTGSSIASIGLGVAVASETEVYVAENVGVARVRAYAIAPPHTYRFVADAPFAFAPVRFIALDAKSVYWATDTNIWSAPR